jgi:UPF0716 protein FxsA
MHPAIFVLLFPLLELYLLIRLGQVIGALETLGVVVGTLGLGLVVLSRQQQAIQARLRRDWHRGRSPLPGILGLPLTLIGALALIAPGLVTDTAGVLLLLPPVQHLIVRRWLRGWQESVASPGGTDPIEGEFRPTDERPRSGLDWETRDSDRDR